MAKGDLAGAEVLSRHCFEIREKVLGKDHPDTLASASGLARILDAQGDLAGAEPLYRRAVDGLARTVGKNHAYWLEAAYGFALLRQRQGHADEAQALAKEVSDRARKVLPESNSDRRKYEIGLPKGETR